MDVLESIPIGYQATLKHRPSSKQKDSNRLIGKRTNRVCSNVKAMTPHPKRKEYKKSPVSGAFSKGVMVITNVALFLRRYR